MKNAGIIGNMLMGTVVIAQLFETNKAPENSVFLLVFLLGLAFNTLAYEIKFVKDHSWSYGHLAIALIFMINTFWCPVIESKLALSLALVAYHGLLVKKPHGFNVLGYLIATCIYLYEGYEIIKEHDKSFISWIKIIACVLFVIYYGSHVKEENGLDSNKEH